MKNLIKIIIVQLLYKLFTEKEIFEIAKAKSKEQDFVREIKTIEVKKGKRKYTLLVFQALNGVYRINLGRHKEEKDINTNLYGVI